MMSLNTIGKFFNYDDITLKVFMKIIESGNFKLVLKSGFATEALCLQQWEKIVLENNKVRGRNDYGHYLKTYKAYNRLLNEYNAIKSHLLIMCYALDYEAIKFVRSRGYKIDLQNSATYASSIAAALRKSDNILTKLTMKKNELLKLGQAAQADREKVQSFQAILAALSLELGHQVDDTITLSMYNELVKLIEAKQRAQKSAQQRGHYGR